VETSLNDSQVMYWEPAKYVAKLRATKTDANPLLLKTNLGAGHGGASGATSTCVKLRSRTRLSCGRWSWWRCCEE
jgi:protease II